MDLPAYNFDKTNVLSSSSDSTTHLHPISAHPCCNRHSHAQIIHTFCNIIAKSFINILSVNGPKREPCGVPSDSKRQSLMLPHLVYRNTLEK